MSETQQDSTKKYISPDRFHFISWALCMAGVLIPVMVGATIEEGKIESPMAYFFGSFFLAIYLTIPYVIYHNQVVNREMTGCFAQLVFLLSTGVIGAIIILWYWDLIRWIQKMIMKPDFEVRYSINSKGMLRG